MNRSKKEGLEIVQPFLFGRKVEVDSVGEVLRSGGALIVTGPAGIGKSTLLLEAERSARERGMTVLTTTGVQTETYLPYAGLHQLLRPVLHGAKNLPTPQRDALAIAFGEKSADPPSRFLVGLGTLNLLTDEAPEAGLLVVAEDAQWLDYGTSAVLGFIARRLGSDPLSLLVGIRDGNESPLVDAGLSELHLEGLDDVVAGELLDSFAHPLSPAVKARLMEEARGNPLALIELPTALAIEQMAGTAPLPTLLPLTARLERAYAARVNELPTETKSQLLVAAINDSPDVGEILRASARIQRSTDVVPALEDAAAAGLIDLDAGELRFRHPLVRSAIAQSARDADRLAAHSALADMLMSMRIAGRGTGRRRPSGPTTELRKSSRPQHGALRAAVGWGPQSQGLNVRLNSQATSASVDVVSRALPTWRSSSGREERWPDSSNKPNR